MTVVANNNGTVPPQDDANYRGSLESVVTIKVKKIKGLAGYVEVEVLGSPDPQKMYVGDHLTVTNVTTFMNPEANAN